MYTLDKTMITRNFDRASRHYEKYAVLQQTIAGRLLERLDLVRIKPGWVVDMGAGTGITARELEKKFKPAQVLQIDISAAMLRQSSKREKKFFSRQHYVQADIESLPLKDNCIDLVFSSLTYQWCNSLEWVFSEASRLLTANNPLIFATLGPDTLKELRTSWAAVDDAVHVNTFIDMHDVGDALSRAGFQGIVMDVETIILEYTDCAGLMRELKQVGAQNVNTQRQKTLTGKNRLRKLLTAYEHFRRNGELPATYEIVYGLAWKPATAQPRQAGDVVYIPVEKIKK